jgi:hypothetical protein
MKNIFACHLNDYTCRGVTTTTYRNAYFVIDLDPGKSDNRQRMQGGSDGQKKINNVNTKKSRLFLRDFFTQLFIVEARAIKFWIVRVSGIQRAWSLGMARKNLFTYRVVFILLSGTCVSFFACLSRKSTRGTVSLSLFTKPALYRFQFFDRDIT